MVRRVPSVTPQPRRHHSSDRVPGADASALAFDEQVPAWNDRKAISSEEIADTGSLPDRPIITSDAACAEEPCANPPRAGHGDL